jgi:hypothetical protein
LPTLKTTSSSTQGIEDFEVAMAAYWAACRRWPKAKITLRQDARVVHMSWRDWCRAYFCNADMTNGDVTGWLAWSDSNSGIRP